MKKIVYAYLAILAGVFIIFFILGSNSDYAVEQAAFKAQKKYLGITKDPKVVPEQEFAEVIQQYEKILKRFPKSRLIPTIKMLIAQTYYYKKDYQMAHEKLNQVIKEYPDNKELLAEALVAIGQTYEAQNNWPQAKSTYDKITKDYPTTRPGIIMPVYIINKHKKDGNNKNVSEAYGEAIAHYSSLAAKNPDSQIEYVALKYLSNCYLDQQRWKEAVDTLGKIILKYTKPKYMNAQTLDMLVKTINSVSIYKLKDYVLPKSIYKSILEKNPDHPLKKYFQRLNEALSTLEEQNVTVTPAK